MKLGVIGVMIHVEKLRAEAMRGESDGGRGISSGRRCRHGRKRLIREEEMRVSLSGWELDARIVLTQI